MQILTTNFCLLVSVEIVEKFSEEVELVDVLRCTIELTKLAYADIAECIGPEILGPRCRS